jgi:hypothetical protein
MSEITRKLAPDRSKIAVDDDQEVKYWTRHLGVNLAELLRVINKVGPSAASVRKELVGIEAPPPTPSSA